MTRRQELEIEQLGATALSRQTPVASRKRATFRLARESLLGLLVLTLVTSCIVADPPTYTDAVVTRPELAAYGAKPFVYQTVIIQAPSASTPSFSVPVRSEDAGEQLLANFWRDYGTSSQKIIDSKFVAPSTYNDTGDREIGFSWTTVSADDNGCHTVSMVVAHLSSYTSSPQVLDPKKADTDAAVVTWWVNVNPPANALTTLVDCPTQQAPVQ